MPFSTEPPHLTPEQFRALGHRTVDFLADYMAGIERFPVQPRLEPGQVAAAIPAHPPQRGLGEAVDPIAAWAEVFDDLERTILPGLMHWQSPSFFGYFPCNSSAPGIIGELLSAGLNVNGMLWATGPASTELEVRVLDWLGELLALPEAFLHRSALGGGGCIQGTASESTLIAMIAARGRALGMSPGKAPELVAYASTQAHSSVIKGAMIAGIASGPEDRRHVRLIETDDTYAMRPELLARALLEDTSAGRLPFFVCATVGTTSSTAVDPVPAIAAVLEEDRLATGRPRRPWLHIDAAHAGCACICPELRWMLDGVDEAESLCLNPHKWLLTNFDCDCFYVRDAAALTAALAITPEYLRNAATASGRVVDLRDWQVALGRRFRALKLWLVLRHYGAEGLRAHIRGHISLAERFESWVRADPRFEVAAPRTVNLVCFRLRGEGEESDQANRTLLERVNASGRAFLTHTTLRVRGGRERCTLRMAIGSPGTQERHVRAAWELIQREGCEVSG
jgi:aromatic-L-amino-acid decarboxylase